MTDEPKLKPCPFCGGDAITTPSVVDRLVMYAHCKDHTCPGWTVSRTNAAYWNLRATPPEVTALVKASTALRDQIARWHEGGPPAGPEESKALFEALDRALAAYEAANE